MRRQHIPLVCRAVYEHGTSPCQACHLWVAHPIRRWYQHLQGETSYRSPCLHQHSDAHGSSRRVPVYCCLSYQLYNLPKVLKGGAKWEAHTSSPGEHVASRLCQMDCLAPFDTTISSAPYSSPFSPCSFLWMALRSVEVPVLGE